MKEIKITLSPEEQSALMQLIDAALRHSGSGALDVAAHFKAKIASALKTREVDQVRGATK